MPRLTNITITPNGTVWTISGQVGNTPVTTDVDLFSLAIMRRGIPSNQDILNQTILQLRALLLQTQVTQLASNPPNVDHIDF